VETAEQPNISRVDAEALIDRLHALHETIPPNEQQALESFMLTVQAQFADSGLEQLLADLPDAPELLADVVGLSLSDDGFSTNQQQGFFTTITTTLTTIIIGCPAPEPPPQPQPPPPLSTNPPPGTTCA